MRDRSKQSNSCSNTTRLPERYQNWDNFGLCYTSFSIRDLKEKAHKSSKLTTYCGHCEEPIETPVQQFFRSELSDDIQLSSFFKDKTCSACGVPTKYFECFLDGTLIIDTQFVPEERN
jgi:hypothetical protein